MDIINLQLFFIAAFIVVIAPGPGMLFVISRSLAGGRKAGFIAALGTSTGIAVHILLAGFGLSLIIFATDIGFNIMKWVGGIYLIFLAWKAFVHRQGLTLESRKEDISHASIF